MNFRVHLLFGALMLAMPLLAQVSPYIHVDQFGYLVSAEKVAVLSDPQEGFNASLSYQPPQNLEVRNASSDAVVFTGPVEQWNNGSTHEQSGDKGWWFDFSDVTTPGEFYVFDALNNERSATFEIGSRPYDEILKAAGRMFYYNRCNSAKEAPYAESNWTDGIDHVQTLQDSECSYLYDPENAALRKDLTGGWWDAGDYNKYVRFAVTAVHDLLQAWEENPAAFGDDWNIPESGNGIADIIDEVIWELDWVTKMTNPDGSVHNKMGSIDYGHNTQIPPSNNTDRRYYGPTCTSASASVVAMFAHAAFVLGKIPQLQNYAAELEATALLCYAYVKDYMDVNNFSLETNCDDGQIKAGDADADWFAQIELMITGEIYLLTLTQDTSYNYYTGNWYWSTEQSNYYWSGNKTDLEGALVHYLSLPSTIARDYIQEDIRTKLIGAANGNDVGYFGWTEADLYRAQMRSVDYFWGSNRIKAQLGRLNLQVEQVDPNFAGDGRRKAAQQLHYFHGVNPLGLVYLSNAYEQGADRCINEIYHGWFADGSDYDHALNSTFGPPPGYLVGGPTYQYASPNVEPAPDLLSPPHGQPVQKAYLDFNTSFPRNSWIVAEPAIYYQAAYVRLLANYVGNEMPPSDDDATHLELNDQTIGFYLSPLGDKFILEGDLEQYNVTVLRADETIFQELNLTGDQATLLISDFPAGALIKAVHKSNQVLHFQNHLQ
ncbi:MAG: glycoside hydrolase family 9 protein [Saprospiraceae bacterium]|nr:glycoside hydrolase family 9 protein [Saprospiraceae bacterium]